MVELGAASLGDVKLERLVSLSGGHYLHSR